MILFASDLDNTLIYSYKHDIGKNIVPVEKYKGRDISYMTEKAYRLIDELRCKISFVPISTRSKEQYERIIFNERWSPSLALTGNGGTLLINGVEDYEWKEASKRLTADSSEELRDAVQILEKDSSRSFEIRMVDELFVFTKSDKPEESVEMLKRLVCGSKINVFSNGTKVYAVPKALNKGEALRRLKAYTGADTVVSAGDSMFDVDMLEEADIPFTVSEIRNFVRNPRLIVAEEGELLSDKVLEYIKTLI